MFDPDWVALLGRSVDAHLASHKTRNLVEEGQSGGFYLDNGVWMRSDAMRRIALELPAAEIAARLLGTRNLWLYDDQMLVKEPGTSAPTPWHQDATYFKCAGSQICAIWFPADAATPETGAVSYIRGSHKWGKEYLPPRWAKNSSLLYDDNARPPELAELPDIDAKLADYDILNFSYEPGDCSVHHVRTVHGSRGNSSSTRRRRAISIRYCGDDVVYASRPYAPPQPHLKEDKKDGDPIASALHPQVWPH